MSQEARYPIGEQSFEALRERDCLYVDKTHKIEQLLKSGSKYYFLGRPRRFGKSLFLSTLACFFQGKRHLFKGLYAGTMDWDWKPSPVLYLDLNIDTYAYETSLADVIEHSLKRWENEYGINPDSSATSVRFSTIIETAYKKTGKQVVVLIDEYDKPLVANLHNKDRFDKFRLQLTGLYSNFKSSAPFLRFVFLTGVSRFAHLSVFSGLNNINDISFQDEYSDICGISECELHHNFQYGINALADKIGKSTQETVGILKRHYDGYHFSEAGEDIYNPYSLLLVMEKRKLDNYWIKSGLPTIIEQQLKKNNTDLRGIFNMQCSQSMLEGLDFESSNPVALLYQTGYLTIKSVNRAMIYTLGLPNEEVKEGFLSYLLPKYSQIPNHDTPFSVFKFIEEFENGDVEGVMSRLKSMFANVPYEMEIDSERNLHNVLYMLMMLIGMNVTTEYHTSNGRIDLFIDTDRYCYIIELKIDKSAREAIDQINRKGYALPFAATGKEIIKIGVNFSTSTRTITEWIAEGYQHTIP